MNTRELEMYLQMKMGEDLIAEMEAEAVAATVEAINKARDDAEEAGEDPDEAEAAVEPVTPRRLTNDDLPTLEWCGRIARSHARAAKGKTGKLKGLREEILARVKADPDTNGKRPEGAGPPGG